MCEQKKQETKQLVFTDTPTLNPLISVTLSWLQHEDHFHVLFFLEKKIISWYLCNTRMGW